jgi:hypothetical protein
MKGAKKILKYKDLTIEIQFTRNVKVKLTPVTTGANNTIIYGKLTKKISEYTGKFHTRTGHEGPEGERR